MEKALEQQRAALAAFREKLQAASLGEQRASVIQQVEPLRLQGEPLWPPAEPLRPQAGAGIPRTARAGSKAPLSEASAAESAAFFTVPWPGSLPLSMPNVQLATATCDALGSGEVNKLVESAASKHGLSAGLLRSVMKQESAFKPCALSTAGAMGLMQIMPETADMLHLEDPYDPARNVDAGAKFLKMMLDRFGGDVPLALAAYNAGPGAVDKAGGVPPIAETVQYLSNILGDLPVAY